MFIAELFIIAKTWKWPRSPLADEWVRKLLFTSVQPLSHVQLFATPRMQRKHTWLPYPFQLLELAQTHVHKVIDAIQPSHPLSSPSPPAFSLSQNQGFFPVSQFFTSGGQSIGVSASASVLPMDIQHQFPLELTGGSPCSTRDSQESSPTPQFKSINSLVVNFLYSPTLSTIHDCWISHSFY